jgi:hypothetical protein
VVSAPASGTQVRGFTPGRSRRIFRAKQFSARRPSEEKLSSPSHVAVLRHVKDPYNYHGSRSCKLNSLGRFSPIVFPFSARGLSRHLCTERTWRVQVRPKTGWYIQDVVLTVGKLTSPTVKKKKKKQGVKRCSCKSYCSRYRLKFLK